MSLRTPTSRRHASKETKLNLVPILDAVFIFIFFLLMSAQFVKIFELGSDVPIVSSEPPPPSNKKPLSLMININRSTIEVYAGIPERLIKVVRKNREGEYAVEELHNFLVGLKRRNQSERTVVLNPKIDLTYEKLVEIMDAIRMFKKTDEPLYRTDKVNGDVKVNELFDKIMFGNLMS